MAPSRNRRWMLTVVAMTVTTMACSNSAESPAMRADDRAPSPVSDASSAGRAVQLEMKNVRLHVAVNVILDVASLRGTMIPTQAIGPPVFDDQRSYVLHLSSAEVRMDMASLTHLMNDHVFAHEGSPLTHVTASEDNGRLAIKGTLHKGVAVPFSAKATIGRAGDGRLRLHTEQVSAFGIPATKVMDIFGLELDDLVSLERRAITVRDDDILMAAGEILPPPVMRGNLSDAKLTGNRLMMRFSPGDSHAPPDLAPPRPDARGYVYFSGASIQFGKLTMTGADLQLIDADDRDPFDFFPARYRRQLVAGYSKNTPEGGLATYMPDYDDVDRTTDLTPSKPATTSE